MLVDAHRFVLRVDAITRHETPTARRATAAAIVTSASMTADETLRSNTTTTTTATSTSHNPPPERRTHHHQSSSASTNEDTITQRPRIEQSKITRTLPTEHRRVKMHRGHHRIAVDIAAPITLRTTAAESPHHLPPSLRSVALPPSLRSVANEDEPNRCCTAWAETPRASPISRHVAPRFRAWRTICEIIRRSSDVGRRYFANCSR